VAGAVLHDNVAGVEGDGVARCHLQHERSAHNMHNVNSFGPVEPWGVGFHNQSQPKQLLLSVRESLGHHLFERLWTHVGGWAGHLGVWGDRDQCGGYPTRSREVTGRGRELAIGRQNRRLIAAPQMLSQDGESALTMRALARELGISPMAIYRYVADQDALIDLALDFALADCIPEIEPGSAWQNQLIAYFTQFWQVMTHEPGLGAIAVTRPMLGPPARRYHRSRPNGLSPRLHKSANT